MTKQDTPEQPLLGSLGPALALALASLTPEQPLLGSLGPALALALTLASLTPVLLVPQLSQASWSA